MKNHSKGNNMNGSYLCQIKNGDFKGGLCRKKSIGRGRRQEPPSSAILCQKIQNFLWTLFPAVKRWICRIEIFGIQVILHNP